MRARAVGRTVVPVLAAALLAPAFAAAQSAPAPAAARGAAAPDSVDPSRAVLRGVVRGEDGAPIAGAEIELQGADVRGAQRAPIVVRSADSGAFRVAELPAGQYILRVRRLGFTPLYLPMTLDRGERRAVVAELDRIPVSLGAVEIRERSGYGDRDWKLREFTERRRSSVGRFFTRDDLEKRYGTGGTLLWALAMEAPLNQCGQGAWRLDGRSTRADLLTGLRATRNTLPSALDRGPSRSGDAGGCSVLLSIDGARPVDAALAGDLPLGWVDAVEVYQGVAATQRFMQPLQSGGLVVVVWTAAALAAND